jgi:hypothetical protein
LFGLRLPWHLVTGGVSPGQEKTALPCLLHVTLRAQRDRRHDRRHPLPLAFR